MEEETREWLNELFGNPEDGRISISADDTTSSTRGWARQLFANDD